MHTSKHATKEAESPTSDQIKEFFSQIKSGKVNKRKLQAFLGNGVKHVDQDLARDILGKDFISPNEVQKARNVSYTSEQLKELEETIPTKEELKKFRENNMTLMPAPPKGMSLLEIRKLNPDLFYLNDKKVKEFSTTDKTHFGWLAIRKDELPGSTERKLVEQKNWYTSSEMRIPNVAEMAWAITTYKEIRNFSLFSVFRVRTSSNLSVGSKSSKLYIISFYEGHRYESLGLAVAWKL